MIKANAMTSCRHAVIRLSAAIFDTNAARSTASRTRTERRSSRPTFRANNQRQPTQHRQNNHTKGRYMLSLFRCLYQTRLKYSPIQSYILCLVIQLKGCSTIVV